MFSKLSLPQISALIPFFRARPKFSLFANAAKFEVDRTIPNHPCDFYSLESRDAQYFYCFRHNRLPDANRPILMIGSEGKVNEDDIVKGLEQVKLLEPEFDQICLLLAVHNLATPARKYLTTVCNLKETSYVPCHNFYVTSSVYPQIQAKVNQISLPSSFSIGSTRLSDAEVVNSTWKFATPEDILQQKEKITRLPTACIFHEDRPIAFEMIGLHGQLSHQYTFPEYRNKGFGAIIENTIVSKCISHGIIPLKSVELTNTSVLKRSYEHPLWQVVADDDGHVLIGDYFALFANAVKFELERTIPSHPCDFYLLKTKNAQYFYCFRHDNIPDHNRPILMIGSDGEVSEKDVVYGLKQVRAAEPIFQSIWILAAFSELAAPARDYLISVCKMEQCSHEPCFNFYVAPSKLKLIEDKMNKISLSSSFSIGSTRLSDAEVVNSTWKFATPEDILQQKEKIERLPTACIFHEDRPIAFEMIGVHGQLSHQFTFPEYRNRGFGTMVECAIISKCIRSGITPVKSVEIINESVVRRSLENPIWHVVSDEKGDPAVHDYFVFA
ncbi:unnamed protein product [Caenorhabditis sp. 36 PRJEB53466]|nr:unnamed protein product [Caenorhabditis sp. 36 PRJEB53466]